MRNPFKRLNYWVQTLFYCALFLGLLVLIFKIASPFHRVYDLSSQKRFSFTEDTLEIFKKVGKRPVELVGFFKENDPDIREIESFASRLKNYMPSLTFHHYNLEQDPDKAKEYQVHEVGTLLINLEGRRNLILELNDSGIRTTFKELLMKKRPLIFFTTGHREAVLGEIGALGYSFLKDRLENAAYVVKQGFIDGPLLDEADLVVISYPKKDFYMDEIVRIREFIKTKNIIFMIDPEEAGTYPSLRGLVLELGVALGDDVILDRTSRSYGADDLIPVVTNFTQHPIVRHFDVPLFFPLSRSLQMIESGESSVWKKDYLIFSGKDSWGESDYQSLEKGNYSFSETRDQKGPLALAIALKRKEGPNNRILVFGDSDFVNNTNFNVGSNRLLFLNSVSWALDSNLIFTGNVNKAKSQTWVLPSEKKGTLLFLMVFTPALLSFLILGLLFLKRRQSV